MKAVRKWCMRAMALVCAGAWVGIGIAWGQPFENCIQSIENATVVIPASVEATVGEGVSLEEGDEIALYTSDGTCAGRGTWSGENLSIAAAGASDPQPDGFEPQEPLAFRVWDASTDQVYVGEAIYAACDGSDPLCRDDGLYAHGVIFSVAELHAATPLPVELVALEATVVNRDIVLTWATASETENAGFEVQHQGPEVADGTWWRVAFVEGHGTTSDVQNYSYRLTGLRPGTHRFRLKQIDFDGTVEFSQAVEAIVELEGAYDLVAPYPNPFRQHATLALTVAEEQRVDIVAYNQLGQRVATLHSGPLRPNASYTFRLDGDRLTSGTYFIRVQGERFSTTRRATLVR